MPCPVRPQCIAHAVSIGEPYGIWGGTSEADRRQRSTNKRTNLGIPVMKEGPST
ncbi:WhiB family transcriptional regulator [Rhodococcus koreensis]|uniref:WhiB family transcriptional regulator n=1 Tax=Rhodococcus koreensis TaxID=99653 RepID=UPI00366CDB32